MFKKITFFVLVSLSALAQINVGPAIHNLNTRTTGLEDNISNLTITVNTLSNSIPCISIRAVKPTLAFLSAYSNTLYTASSGVSGITFLSPEAYTNKENEIYIHLTKDVGTVTWFTNIYWVYGEVPVLDTNYTYRIKLSSINGINWQGIVEYPY